MRTIKIALSTSLLLLAPACTRVQPDPFAGKWVDLTHTLDEQSIFWPTAEGFRHEEVMHGKTPGGWFYSSYNINLSGHGGTHLDAPIHFAQGGKTADQLPLDRLIGAAAIIDVSAKCAANRDYRFTKADIEAWEDANGKLPKGAIVLFRTGFSKFWPDRKAYMGTDLKGEEGVAQLHFPGLSEEAAKFLAEDREVSGVGLDTPSLDYGQSKDFIAHRILLEKNIPGFENVTNLEQLPASGAHVIALPVKIGNGSGGPLRIIALVPDGKI